MNEQLPASRVACRGAPADLLVELAGAVSRVASRYDRFLAGRKRRASDAQLRRLDRLEQCCAFFWACSELIVQSTFEDPCEALAKEHLPLWKVGSKGSTSLHRVCQGQSYASVLEHCLETILESAKDKYLAEFFDEATLVALRDVACRIPRPEIRGVDSKGDVVFLIQDDLPQRVQDHINAIG